MAVYQFPFNNPNTYDGFDSTLPPRTNPHRGLDFAQPIGTPIPAIADGVISGIYYTDVLGNITEVYHQADGRYSGYCHSDQPSTLSEGQAVTRGQIINYVGNTGFSTGAHLHLTISPDRYGVAEGRVEDPYAYINARISGTPITPGPGLPPPDIPGGSEKWTDNLEIRPSIKLKAASGKVRITIAGTGLGALMTYSIPGVRERDEALNGVGVRAAQLLFSDTKNLHTATRSWVQEVPKDEEITITAETYGTTAFGTLICPSITAEVVY